METLERLFSGYLADSPVIVPIGVNPVLVYPVVVRSVLFCPIIVCPVCPLCFWAIEISVHNIELALNLYSDDCWLVSFSCWESI